LVEGKVDIYNLGNKVAVKEAPNLLGEQAFKQKEKRTADAIAST
jgi:hypothetical protein